MARLIVLDTTPLSELGRPRGHPLGDRARRWLVRLESAGVRVIMPQIADYEVRRKLLHFGATAGIARLDGLKARLEYRPITTAVMRRAAEVWAYLRSIGLPTAGPDALDADAILIAQALDAGRSGDVLTIATANVKHIDRYPGVDARRWDTIP